MGWDLEWVTDTVTVDAIEHDTVSALNSNPGWRLLHTGTGAGGQTTLTYGWPFPLDTEQPEPVRSFP